MKYQFLRLFIVLMPAISATHAGAAMWNTDLDIRPVLAVTEGFAFLSDVGFSKDFPLGFSTYHYESSHDKTAGTVGVFVGVEINPHPLWALQTGVAFFEVFPETFSGKVTQGIDPQSFSTFDYDYRFESQRVVFENKLLFNWREDFHPYVLIDLGAAFNETSDYTIDTQFTTLTPIYEDHTDTAFTYGIGVGLDYDITDDVRFGIGYRISSLGKSSLVDGVINDHSVPSDLTNNAIVLQEALLQLIWRI